MASLDNVKGYLDEYAELKLSEKAIKERLKELDAIVRPVLVDRGSVISGNSAFDCVTKPGRKTFQRKMFEEHHPEIDLDLYYKQGAPFTQLTIKEVENANE